MTSVCVCESHLCSVLTSGSAVSLWVCVRVRWTARGRDLQAMPTRDGVVEVWSEWAEPVCGSVNPKLLTQSSADPRSAAESRPTVAPSLELTDDQTLMNHCMNTSSSVLKCPCDAIL